MPERILSASEMDHNAHLHLDLARYGVIGKALPIESDEEYEEDSDEDNEQKEALDSYHSEDLHHATTTHDDFRRLGLDELLGGFVDDDDLSSESEEVVLYMAKAPMKPSSVRVNTHESFSRRDDSGSGLTTHSRCITTASLGEFVESLEEVELGSTIDESIGIPDLPTNSEQNLSPSRQHYLLNNIDSAFSGRQIEQSSTSDKSSRFILRNESSETCGLTSVPAGFSVILDEANMCIGVDVPRTDIPMACIPTDAAMTETMIAYIQLSRGSSRVIKFRASIEEDHDKWVIKNQLIRLEPFKNEKNGIRAIMEDISALDLSHGFAKIVAKSDEEILRLRNDEKSTLLHFLVVENRRPRAEIVALSKRLLACPDQVRRMHLMQRDKNGYSPFEYACLSNRPLEARFLAELYYCLGGDLMREISNGNTILHLLAKAGDECAETFETLLKLRLSRSDRMLFRPDVATRNGELPIHIAVKSKVCQKKLLQILHTYYPECMSATTTAKGSTPLHLACQMSQDPTTLALLNYYNPNAINQKRYDGITPIHLVAARSDIHDKSVGLYKLDERNQIRMLEILIQHGADLTIEVCGKTAKDLVHLDRSSIKELL